MCSLRISSISSNKSIIVAHISRSSSSYYNTTTTTTRYYYSIHYQPPFIREERTQLSISLINSLHLSSHPTLQILLSTLLYIIIIYIIYYYYYYMRREKSTSYECAMSLSLSVFKKQKKKNLLFFFCFLFCNAVFTLRRCISKTTTSSSLVIRAHHALF